MTIATMDDYLPALKAQLPPSAFRPAPWRLLHFFGYTAIALAGIAAVGHVESLAAKLAILLINGLALTSITLQAHDLSHGQIIRRRSTRYPLELLAWGWAFFPPTMWDRLHNRLHHRAPSGPQDPDRRFYERERARSTRTYSLLLFPSRHTFPWNPLTHLGLAYHAHLIKHLAWALVPSLMRDSRLLTVKPRYTPAERVRIGLELLSAVAMHAGLLLLAGGLGGYLWSVGLPLGISAVVNINYVFTQHALRPLTVDNDPVLNTTSLRLPRWLDWHHHYTSHHVEHHIFPSMATHHHPEVRRIMIGLIGDRFPLMGPQDVYRAFRSIETFIPPA